MTHDLNVTAAKLSPLLRMDLEFYEGDPSSGQQEGAKSTLAGL